MKHPSPEREYVYDPEPPGISVAHIIHVLRRYTPVILLTLAAVAMGYAIYAIGRYLLTPAQRVTVQTFRLEFKGAAEGMYPNGVKFSPAEIISTPVLLRVYNENQLQRFISFPQFSRSLFVHESNPEYERIASEYRSRLSDPKLMPVDRDRITAEFEAKRASLSKGDLALHFVRLEGTRDVPETLVRKVLADILTVWSNRAVREQRVLHHRVSVVSPDIVNAGVVEQSEPIAAIHVLRLKIERVIEDLRELEELPGSELARTPKGGLSIEEIRIRLEEIIRFRLEPLVAVASVSDPAAARRFLEAQLAYDQRILASRRQAVEAIRTAINAYSMQSRAATVEGPPAATPPQNQNGTEAVTPQVSEGFLDRLMTLANQSTDVGYRQSLVSALRYASERVIPAENAVAEDHNLLRLLASAPAATPTSQASLRQQIEQSRREVRQLIGSINEVHQVVSANLHPSTQLYSVIGSSTTAVERGVKVGRLIGIGLLVLLVSLPITVLLCFIHNKVREEEAEEMEAARTAQTSPAAG